ncbi:hypothetical protein TRICI_004786 [Trichomonascus ciferrii]|uniref:Major facilitator superfamily (MFS) profile domain-containing protein n=1 Tax=Trichomonascus ciferrii TaxID=44093 RepID=A0A642UZC3_9ASCO|nr:hypothetical protein TRICI_004786 [Trichomonascus ciferrii]
MVKANEIDYSLNDPRNKWKILQTHWRYGLWALWVSMGTMMLGGDYLVGGQLLPMEHFKEQFGELLDGEYVIPSNYASAWSSIGLAFDLVAALFTHPLMDKYGRKPLIFVASIISIVGVLLQHLATEWRLHLVGRAINGASIGITFTVSPLWIGETCRPELRGFFLCFGNTSAVIGQLLFVLISYGTNFLDNNWSWKAPLMCQYIYPVLFLAGYYWFPESPLWLIRRERVEKAERSLRRMYGVNDERFYSMELNRMQLENQALLDYEAAALEDQKTLWFGIPEPVLFQCFRKTQIRRTFCSILAVTSQQLAGGTFVTNYVTYFLQLINVSNYFLVSVILYIVMLISTCAAYPLVEVVGRRTLIVPASFILSVILLIIGIMGSISNQVAAGWVIVVMIFMWALVFQVSLGASSFVAASELATLRLRAANQSLVTIFQALWSLIFQFTVPYMISKDAGNLGGKTGYIFFGTCATAFVFLYFYLPETKGLSFATLDELFARGVPARKFKTEGRKITMELLDSRDRKKATEEEVEHIEDVDV